MEDGSGGEAYYYGRQGEVTKTVCTVVASTADIRTWVYGATYDSWNRERTMTYPDGEVVTYHYNAAGQIESLTGNKLGKQSVIVKKIGYDKEGRTVMDNKYRYDAVDNILGISNVVNPQSLNKHNPAKLGGAFTHSYQYDDLNRLISATGKAKNASYQMQMTFGKMSEPLTKVQKVDSTETAKSYNLAYKYEDENHPTAPTEIGHEHYTYDANGNPILVENDSTNESREMYWDEENRLMVLKDNNGINRYTYNAAGERTMKVSGSMEGVYINGAPQGITFHETDNFTLYPASILSVNKNRFTKHYFLGDKRVASRIGTGLFNNVYGRNGSYVTAGQQDYAERMNQIQKQKEAYYKQQGIAPGVPTMKGAYGDPENTKRGYNSIIDTLGNHDVPQGWIQTPRPNTTPNTNPGPPVSWNDPSNPDDPQAGYGYIPNDTTKEETFFYHSDHLGSTSYITDDKANITQYDAYLPYGELLVDEHSSSEDLPYKFNGKELDQETGLYYYGARYMNPVISLWYGVDPMQEKSSFISTYAYTFNNPVHFIDPNGKWGEDANRNLIAEKGDNAWTLAKYLNTSAEISTKMLNEQGYSINENGILNLKVGDIFKVERESPKPEERIDLGFVGNTIRKEAGSEFSKNLFENYWKGNGDVELSGERFAGILLYVKENAPKSSNQTPVTLIGAPSGNVVGHGSKRAVNFYSSSEYDKAFGTATLYYNSKGNIIGFFDHYDFDPKPWGERSYKNELITRAVETASPPEAKDFKIRYGYSKR